MKQRRNRRNTQRKRRQSRRGAARKHRFFTRKTRKTKRQSGGNWAATNGKVPLYAVGKTYVTDGDDVGAARMAMYEDHLEDKEAAEVGVMP